MWNRVLSSQENDVKPSSLYSQKRPIALLQSHPNDYLQAKRLWNELKHNPRNEYQNTLGEIIQGNTIHSHYHFHYCDWWRRNHHLMFTYFAFGVFSCTMESPYLSLVVAPLCIAVLLHQRCFHQSPSISIKTAVHIRIMHQNPGNGEHPLKTQTIQVKHSTTSEMPLYNHFHQQRMESDTHCPSRSVRESIQQTQ